MKAAVHKARIPYLAYIVVPVLAVATALFYDYRFVVPKKTCSDITALYYEFVPDLFIFNPGGTLVLILGIVGLLVIFRQWYSCVSNRLTDIMGKKTKAKADDGVAAVNGKGPVETLPGLANGNEESECLPTSSSQAKVKINNSELTTTNENGSCAEEAAMDSVVSTVDSASGNGIDLGEETTGTVVKETKNDGETEKEVASCIPEDKSHPEHADKFDTDADVSNGTARTNGKPVLLR